MRPIRALAALAALCLAALPAHAQIENPQATPIPSGPFRIAGVVVNANGGSTLSRCRVTIADVKNRQSTQVALTADDGRFEFHVPAGKYSLQGARRGFITAYYEGHDQFSTAIVAAPDLDAGNLKLRLSPNAVLTGRVLDEFGEPVRNAQITVYRENHFQGISRVFRYRGASTDDQGRYEVTPLEEGTYFVSAKGSPWYAVHPTSESGQGAPAQVDSSLDVAYPITFYGDATEPEDATPIPVRGGDRLEADIHMNPVPALHIALHIPDNGSGGVSFPVLQKPVFDGFEQAEMGQIQNVAPGLFEMTGVAAGRYSVRMPDSNGRMKEPVEVNLSSGSDLDLSPGNSTASIKADVQIEGAATLPSGLYVELRNSKGRRVDITAVDATGKANFSDVAPGQYSLFANSDSAAYSVDRISTAAATARGHSLTVAPGASLNIALTLVGGSVTVEGFARRSGKAAPAVMIVLVPANAGADPDRFRRDQSDLDGSFSLPSVIPGTYTLIAIEDGWDLDWAKPAALARYLDHGQPVTIGDRSPKTLHLSDPVEVQPK